MAAADSSGAGAWGLRLAGIPDAAQVLVPAPPQWPTADITVRYQAQPPSDFSTSWTATGMHVPLAAGGHLRIGWPHTVELSLAGSPTPECLVQPHLTTAAAAIQMRRGMQPFHAGAFITGRGVWGVLGAKEAGKSSATALASLNGLPVLADDLLVIDAGRAFAGPRCLDLRLGAAQALGIGKPLGVVGLRERWRVYLDDCPSSTPVVGFVVPSWGAEDTELLSPITRLQTLFANSALQGVTMNDPDRYLGLAALPMISWSRPKDWTTARQTFQALLKQLDTL